MSAKKLPVKLGGISPERVERIVLLLRGQKVILDFHLAELYGVEVRVLNQAVKRNIERFPEDFMFQLSKKEIRALMRSQIGIMTRNSSSLAMGSKTDRDANRSQIVIGSQKHRDPRFCPFAFTEQGVSMLSSVLRSPRAVRVNIEIVRAFVRLRQWLASNAELAKRLGDLEKRYDRKFRVVFEALRQLMAEPAIEYPERREIGFHTLRDSMRTRKAAKQAGASVSYL